jgi:hypothetical protein
MLVQFFGNMDPRNSSAPGPLNPVGGTGAVPWLRSLVARLSPQRPGFAPGSVHLGFVVDRVALGQVFFPSSLVFPCQYHSTVVLHTHISYGVWTICPPVAAVQRRSLNAQYQSVGGTLWSFNRKSRRNGVVQPSSGVGNLRPSRSLSAAFWLNPNFTEQVLLFFINTFLFIFLFYS